MILAAAFVAVLVALCAAAGALFLLAPAQAHIDIDTAARVATARVRPLWGKAPELTYAFAQMRPHARGRVETAINLLHDAPRVTHALLVAPKLAPVIKRFLKRLYALRPSSSRIVLSVDAVHPGLNLAVTALSVVLPQLPENWRRGITIVKRESPGLDIAATIDVRAAPLTLRNIFRELTQAPASREFMRRLTRPRKT